MNKYWKVYFGVVFLLFVFTISCTVVGCSGLINPFVDAERTFKEDIRKDLKVLHEKVEGVEDRIEKAVKDLVGCSCDPNRGCNCDKKPAPVTVDQWYQSQDNANIYYYGHVVDGILYYTYWFDAVTRQSYRVMTGNNLGGDLTTKNFKPKAVPSPR